MGLLLLVGASCLATSTYYSLRCTGRRKRAGISVPCGQRLADLYSGQNLHLAIKCPRCGHLNNFSTVRVEVLFLRLQAPKEGGHASVRAAAPRLVGN